MLPFCPDELRDDKLYSPKFQSDEIKVREIETQPIAGGTASKWVLFMIRESSKFSIGNLDNHHQLRAKGIPASNLNSDGFIELRSF